MKGIHSVVYNQWLPISVAEEAKRNVTQALFTKLFDGYQKEFLPRLNESEPVQVHFEFEIITIKEVVSFRTVHTWCSGTSTWVPAQNGVVFTLWVPDMWLCTYLLHFALSDAILKHELSSENKAVDYPELTKIAWTQGPGAHFGALVQGRDLVLEHRHHRHARILACVLEKRVCSH